MTALRLSLRFIGVTATVIVIVIVIVLAIVIALIPELSASFIRQCDRDGTAPVITLRMPLLPLPLFF